MIPVCEPVIGDEEISYVTDALQKGEISGTYGHYLDSFEQEFAAYCGCKHGVAVTSGTTALHLAVAAAGIGEGDEILVSSSTNIATALAIVHNQAIPVPVDVEDDTWNLDVNLIESLITPRTRAIIPVHLFGHPVDMDPLMHIAKHHGLVVIEDCAESHGATYRERMTGSFGDMGCFSFYANKVITTGEGGMVVTNNDTLAEQLRLLRNLAFTTPRFRHEVAGYNYRMTGYQAAMGLAQTRRIEHIIDQKRRLAHRYNELLSRVPGLRLPTEREWVRNVYWMYAIEITPEFGLSRDELALCLRNEGIDTRTFFCPMNQQPCLQVIPGFRAMSCPVADRIWQTGLYLPSTYTLDESTIQHITDKIVQIQKTRIQS
jgi:perosamine synthetase